MTKISTKKALMLSLLSMLICVSMLVGSTFAWFTDTATASVNNIQSGTLDVELKMATEWETDGTVKTWESAEGETLSFKKASTASGTDVLWEPGCTYALPELKVVNKGNLALKYKILITGINGSAELNDVIDWTISGDELGKEYTLMAKAESSVLKISGHMQETAGNDYQDKTIDGIAITVVATQYNYEYDSTDNTYDKDAVLPVASTAKGNLTVTQKTSNDKAVISGEQKLSDSVMSVTYPNGVILSTTTVSTGDDKTQKSSVAQELKYVDDTASSAMQDVSITADKAVASYTLTLPVDTTNTTLVTVTINYTPGLSGVQIYHSGDLLAGSASAAGDAKEYAEYNSTSGVITLHLLHASPIDIIYDKPGIATVTTRAELESALADESITTIKLGSDISNPEGETSAINVLRDVTIDFNGHVLGVALENGTDSYKGPANSLVLTDSTNTDRSGDTSTIKIFDNGGFQQHAAVASWQNKVTINGGYYEHNNGVVWSQQQMTDETQDILVINGGKFVGKGGASTIYSGGGTVTVNGGIFTAEYNSTGECGDCIYVSYVTKSVAAITNINAGTFTSANRLIYVEVADGYTQKVNISGGTFTVGEGDQLVVFSEEVSNAKDFITITGGTFNVDPSDYVDTTKYNVTSNNGTWTVSKK